ncbi:MAG: prepilin peptidase [Calditrichaceae bacterium]|nr:prepilin peptidase [Calditrichaceae bacterium]
MFFDFIFPALTFVHIWHSENLLILSLKLVLIATLISLGLIDWFIYRLPNLLLIVGLIITVLLLVVNSAIYLNHVYGAIIGFGIGFGIRILGKMYYKKEVFGVGDVKLLGFLGLLAGWNFFFPVFFMGMLIASIYSVIAILFKKLDWKSKIPLGSFFCIALIIFQIIDQKCLDFIYQIN